jgi:hypothetical protein
MARKIVIMLILVIVSVISSCDKYDEFGYRVFKIRKGFHRSTFDRDTTKQSSLYFSCIFDSNCEYVTDDPLNQYDINKLYGLSDCGTYHKRNSVRFGWRWDGTSIEINSYVRVDGVFKFSKICNVNVNEPNDYSIVIFTDYYLFKVNDIEYIVDKNCNYEGKRYKLWPYFGGDEKAPHEMVIRIKEY